VTAIQASYTKTDLVLSGPHFKSILNATRSTKEIFTYPDVTCSFGREDLNEGVQALMAGLSFRKESSQGRHYYRGPANPEAIIQVAQKGAAMDTFAPFGATNIHGYSALRNLQRILLSVCAIWDVPCTGGQETAIIDTKTWNVPTKPLASAGLFIIKDISDLVSGQDGLALPYFDSLVRADKTTVPQIVSRYFIRLLGDTEERAIEAFRVFQNGWLSLSTTPQGLALSHFALCIDLALKTGAKPYVLRPNSTYGGVMLIGNGIKILKANTLYKGIAFSALKDQLLKLDTHKRSLSEICALINPLLFPGDKPADKINYIDSSSLISARIIHNLLRHLKIDFDTQKLLRKAILGLKFKPTFWDPMDHKKILAAVKAIVHREFLDDSMPMLAKAEILFCKDSVLSTLSAFGASAPTIVGKGTSYSVAITSKKTMKATGMTGGLSLSGFPIFVKPIQEAHEDWDQVRTSSAITFKLKLREGSAPTVQGTATMIPFTKGGDELNELISLWSSKEKARGDKKRTRGIDDDGESDKKKASKKSKLVSGLNVTFADLGLGWAVGPTVPDPADSEMSS
jgi:hypothetical protein